MKKNFLIVPVIFCLLILVLPSCQKDDENEPDTSGDARSKFVASWTCQENSKLNGPSTYTIHINKDSANSIQIKIENIYNYGFQYAAYAVVSGNSFNISSQLISGNMVQGTGILQGTNSINLSYTVNSGSTVDSVTAILNK